MLVFSSKALPREPAGQTAARYFPYLLLAITFASLIPRLVLGVSQFIHYDGYWHIFIATQNRWPLFVSEWKGDAHPPLHYLVLRAVAKLGDSRLIYRLPSIVPGVASVYIFGRITEKICRDRLVALCATAAYGFSITMIDITCDVRSYPLALFFILCAFYFFTEACWLLFGFFTALAIASEYYSAFFLLACAFLLLLARPTWKAVCLSLGPPLAIAAFLYRAHFRLQPRIENVVSDFYWNPGSSITSFILNGLRSDLNFMLPVELHSTAALIVFLLIAAVAIGYGFAKMTPAARAAILVLILLLAELATLGFARRYPFGGFARQQSVLFPFLVLAGFVVLDAVVQNFKIVIALIAVLIACSFVYQWRRFPKVREELFTPQYSIFENAFPTAHAVYVDQYSLIAYYIHTHNRTWIFQNHFREPDRVDEYQLASASHPPVTVLRNLDAWNFDLSSLDFYKTLARSLDSTDLSGADLFFLKQFPANVLNAANIRKLAADNSLTLGPIVYNNASAFIEFRLAKTDPKMTKASH